MKGVFKSIRNQLIAGAVLFTCIGIGYAVDIPNLFSPNTPVKSSDVNANFNSLKTAVDTLEAKVNALGSNVPLPSKKGKLGYATIVLNGSVLPGTPTFNSSGGPVHVSHPSNNGVYFVTFPGLGDSSDTSTTLQGNIQVTPLFADYNCSGILVAPPSLSDVKARVDCKDLAGTLADASFSVLVIH